jgi:DNA-binding Lrp family transcriptional regulator
MGQSFNQKSQFKKRTPMCHKHVVPRFENSPESLKSFLDKVKGDFRFHIYNIHSDERMPYASKRSLESAIRNGHSDAEMWIYVNPMQQKVTNYNGTYRTKFEAVDGYNSFVLDIDRLPGIDSIKKMEKYLKSLNMPIPLIVQTGPENFHLAFFTKQDIDKDYIIGIAAKIAKIERIPADSFGARAAFARTGVDYNYIVQTHKSHKIRLPGSINHNHIVDKKPFVCKSNFKMSYMEDFVADMELELPEKEQELRKKYTKKQKDPYMVLLLKDEISKVVGKRNALRVARYIYDNLGFLRKNNCAIPQERIGRILNIQQPAVSKILKKLCDGGYLTIQLGGYYNFQERFGKTVCKVYGGGIRLWNLLSKPTENALNAVAKRVSTLKEEYEPGSSYHQYLKDVRDLYYLGASAEETIEIISIKNLAYMSKNYKKRNWKNEEIRTAYLQWQEKVKNSDNKFLKLRLSNFDFSKIKQELGTECIKQQIIF